MDSAPESQPLRIYFCSNNAQLSVDSDLDHLVAWPGLHGNTERIEYKATAESERSISPNAVMSLLGPPHGQ